MSNSRRSSQKLIDKLKPIFYNITKDEKKALHNLRKDECHIILTANKGVALVIIDKVMHIEKCMALLNGEEVYCECRDHTKSIHSKVVKQLLDLKTPLDQKLRTNTSNLPSR